MTTTTAAPADPAVRLADLSAELHQLEQRRQELLEQQNRAGTAAELEEAGRRLAAGEPVEVADVVGELRIVEGRLPIVRKAVEALGHQIAREELRAALPEYREAIEAEVAGFAEIDAAFAAVERAVAEHVARRRRREQLGTALVGLLIAHPDVTAEAQLREYRLALGTETLVVQFEHERVGVQRDRPSLDVIANVVDRWRDRARELEVELPDDSRRRRPLGGHLAG